MHSTASVAVGELTASREGVGEAYHQLAAAAALKNLHGSGLSSFKLLGMKPSLGAAAADWLTLRRCLVPGSDSLPQCMSHAWLQIEYSGVDKMMFFLIA